MAKKNVEKEYYTLVTNPEDILNNIINRGSLNINGCTFFLIMKNELEKISIQLLEIKEDIK